MTTAAAPLDTARILAERFAATAGERDRASAFPHAPLAALREAGLIGLAVPEQLGGGGAGFSDALAVMR